MQLRQLSGKARIVIIGFLVILIAAGAAFFYYWEYYETPVEKWDEAEYSKPSDYEVIETPDGIFVENKKAGLSFMVPDGWRVEKERYRDYIALLSPDFEEKSFIVEKGCKIKAEIRYIKAEFVNIERTLRKGHQEWGYKDEYEIVTMNEHGALKNITGIKDLNQYYIGVYIPDKKIFRSRIYSLGLNSYFEDREQCINGFDKFLKTVVIK